ncbi:MAG: cupin domain-containing protein [Phycisphaerales bacterium]
MAEVFPESVRRLPQADIPLRGLRAWLLQGENHQVLFMQFEEDAEIAMHTHESQWSTVLQGQIDLVVQGVACTYRQGDNYVVPRGVPHSAMIHAGYADITVFDEKSRYEVK